MIARPRVFMMRHLHVDVIHIVCAVVTTGYHLARLVAALTNSLHPETSRLLL